MLLVKFPLPAPYGETVPFYEGDYCDYCKTPSEKGKRFVYFTYGQHMCMAKECHELAQKEWQKHCEDLESDASGT